MGWSSPPAKRIYLVSHDGAHVFVNNLPTIMKEYVPGPLTGYQMHLLTIEDGALDDAAVSLSQACLLAEHLRLLTDSRTVRVSKGLSQAAVCYEMGKLAHTLTPLDHVFVVSDSNELRRVITIPVEENLVFVSPTKLAHVAEFERRYADVLFHSRFDARCVPVEPPPSRALSRHDEARALRL